MAVQVTALVEEYFNSGDLAEAAASLKVCVFCRSALLSSSAAGCRLSPEPGCRMPASRSCTTGSSSAR